MKSFKSYIKEASGFPTGPVGENPNNVGGSLEVNPTDVGDQSMLRRLNAIVGTIGNHEYLVAEHAIGRLRGTLNKIGLSFPEVPQMEGKNGSFDLPLSRFGGRFGKDENTPYDEFLDDDGISHIIEGGLTMKIRYEMMPNNNSCKVYASIA
jgi:hypothetical protein